jgi:protein associated with RNAse G/E
MHNIFNPGETVALRGVYKQWVCYTQSARVIKDTPKETVLLVEPGAECAAPAGYIHKRHGDGTSWNRWHETLNNSLNMEIYSWHTNRFLILLEPQRYFSTIYIWEQASEEFQCYYVNFQTPYTRSHCGFDTLDLDLDLLVDIDNKWEWKDVDDYQNGIETGGITSAWVTKIKHAQDEVFARIENRLYPFDRTWLDWRPGPNWPKTKLPANWDVVDQL